MFRNMKFLPAAAAAAILLTDLGAVAHAQPSLVQDQTTCSALTGSGYTPQQQVDACTRLIQSGRMGQGDMAMAYYNRGRAWVDAQDNAKAAADYTQAIALRPFYPIAFYNRGTAYNHLGRYDDAVQDFTQAIAQQRGYVNAYVNRGNAHAFAGRNAEAIADYNEAIRLNPGVQQAWNNRGVVHRRMGDIAQADADHAEARRLSSAQ